MDKNKLNELENNIAAYAEYLDKQNCEFFILVHDKDTLNTNAVLSEHVAELLSAVFDKSPTVYEAFKLAEQMMESYNFNINMN